jgi:uncharacterized membrane-anchored protein
MTSEQRHRPRTLLDVDLELLSLKTARELRRWSNDPATRMHTTTPDAKTEYRKDCDELLDERLTLSKAGRR